MQRHTESISFGLFLNLNISGTFHLRDFENFLDLNKKCKTKNLVSETLMKLLSFLSYLAFRFRKKCPDRQVWYENIFIIKQLPPEI